MKIVAGSVTFLSILAAIVAIGIIVFRARRAKNLERVKRTIGPTSSEEDLAVYHGSDSKRKAAPSRTPLKHYQYLAEGKIDWLYGQHVDAGRRPQTSMQQFGAASIAQVSETLGPPAELTTVQKLAQLMLILEPIDIEEDQASQRISASNNLIRGTMLMKHAVLPVAIRDEYPTEAIWIGRQQSGRFICLGGAAANMGAGVPRGLYINSGVSSVLQTMRTASESTGHVQYQPGSSSLSARPPFHAFPGAWDSEVVDVWMHFSQLHTHQVNFLAYVMTSSWLDCHNPDYDVIVGSPICVEFA